MRREEVTVLMSAIPYLREFKRNTFVVKVGGALFKGGHYDHIAEDISFLDVAEVETCVVHGGGPQIDELSKDLRYKPKKVAGRRITHESDLRAAKMVLLGEISPDAVGGLRKYGVNAFSVPGSNFIHATRRPPIEVPVGRGRKRTIDYGYVGEITEVDTALLRTMLDSGYVPVVACLASDASGAMFNINADTAGSAIATALKADKYISVTDVPGVLQDPKDRDSTLSYLSVEEAERLLETGNVSGGMLPKLQSCIAAVRGGVRRAHIIDGTVKHSLLVEVFTEHGAGTMIATENEIENYKAKEIPEG